jgi:SAM-dependent methyltransferase
LRPGRDHHRTRTGGVARRKLRGRRPRAVSGRARTRGGAQAEADIEFEVSSIYELPLPDASFDAVLSHAVFEHLVRPDAALAELRRVLRPGAVLGVCSSDWSGAEIEPRDEDVELALRCHLHLRRKAGGDPYAGGRLPAQVAAAGFVDARVTREHHVDMPYRAFARYIGKRIEAAALNAPAGEQDELLDGAAAARRWARQEDGRVSQPWTAVLARRP